MSVDTSSFAQTTNNPHLGFSAEINPQESLTTTPTQSPLEFPDIPKPKLTPGEIISSPVIGKDAAGGDTLLPRKETRQKELLAICADVNGNHNDAVTKLTTYISAGGKVEDFTPEQLQKFPLLKAAIDAREDGLELLKIAKNAEQLAEAGQITGSSISNDKEHLTVKGKNGKEITASKVAITLLFFSADAILFGGRTSQLIAEELAGQLAEKGVSQLLEGYGIKGLDKAEKRSFVKGMMEASSVKAFEDYFEKASEDNIYEFLKIMGKEATAKLVNGEKFGGFTGEKFQLSKESHTQLLEKLAHLSAPRKQDLGIDKLSLHTKNSATSSPVAATVPAA